MAKHTNKTEFECSLTNRLDTVPGKRLDSVLRRPDSLNTRRDTLPVADTFTLKMSKDSLSGPVKYEAEDSAVVLVQDKKIILYGNTQTVYNDVTLAAPQVELDQQTNIMTATADRDSLGNLLTRARFEQGENTFQSDTIRFNFKTQQGITRNTFTQQGEMFVQGDRIKKVDSATVFISSGRLTTCNYDDPHFAFRTNKLKVVNNRIAVTGPTHPEFEGVPLPVYLPFGFFPLSQGRHSGFLPPQVTTNEQFGLGLEGVGYYKVLNQYVDLTLRGNIYSYGTWSAMLTPTYRKRYRYNGSLNLNFQRTKFNFKGDPDFNLSKTFMINWVHSVDQRARPGTTFSANVNAGSTRHNQLQPNSPVRNFQNRLTSSIAYSKTWAGKPYNLTLSANHSQNNNTRLMNITLPTAGFTMNTIYPFQRKSIVGAKRWYENLGFGYNGTFGNQLAFYDTSRFRIGDLIDTMQWGAQHRFPITMSLPPVGPLILSPSISYQQVWLQTASERSWNRATKRYDTTISRGFFFDQEVTFGMSASTNIFGTLRFQQARVAAIRHVVRPQVSFNYRPDLSGKNYYDLKDSTNQVVGRFSRFAGNLYPAFSEGAFGGISFGIDNTLEMKWRSRKDTGASAIRKIRLIDGFGLNSGYNFLVDSLQLQNFNLYLRSTLFEKINITASALLSPYQTNLRGQAINRYAWADGFSLGTLQFGSIAISTQFRSKEKDADKKKAAGTADDELLTNTGRRITDPALLADQAMLMDYMRQNPGEFVDFNIPWDVSLQFSAGFSRRLKPDYSGFETEFNANIGANGNFNLTPKWKFGINNLFYDFKQSQIQTFTMSISRDMHCWQMSINVTPVGPYRFFSFTINPKAALLQDLRVNRSRTFSDF